MVQPKSNRLLTEAQIAAPNGVAGLGLDAKVPAVQIKSGAPGTLATLDADGKIPDAQIPATGTEVTTQLTALSAATSRKWTL